MIIFLNPWTDIFFSCSKHKSLKFDHLKKTKLFYLSVKCPKTEKRRSSSELLLRVDGLWSEAESEAPEGLQRSHCSRCVGFPSTPRYSSETNVNPDHWDGRILSVTSWTNLQCSFSPMISVYMWTTGHQKLLLISHEERLQLYLTIIDSVHFKTFLLLLLSAEVNDDFQCTHIKLTLISKVFSEMYWS